MEAPAWDINNSSSLQSFIKVGNRWMLLPNFYIVVMADLTEMLLENNSCNSTSRSIKLILQKFACSIELGIKQVSLNKLSNLKKRTVKPTFNCLHYGDLLLEVRHGRFIVGEHVTETTYL